MSQYKIRDLHPVFHNSPHLIAVGTKNGCCFLVHLGFDLPLVEHDQGFNSKLPSFITDICGKFEVLEFVLENFLSFV